MLRNLLGNALKYSETEPHVSVSAEASPSRCWISVEDNGIGIPKDQHEAVFDAFTRLHTRQHYDGTGIGLALCKRLVARMGGDIVVESEPGLGSRFSFPVPRAPLDALDAG